MDNVPNPLTLLLEMGQAFHSTLELGPLLGSILKQLQSAAQSAGGSIWLLNERKTELECTHTIGLDTDTVGQIVALSDLVTWTELQSWQAIKVDQVAGSRWQAALTDKFRTPAHNMLVVPLVARGDLLGLLLMTDRLRAEGFTKDDLELVTALAGHAAIAIQNAQLYDQQHRNAERQSLLDQISRYLQQTIDLDELIPRIFAEVNKAIHAEAQSIWMVNEDAGVITCRFATGPGAENVKQVNVPMGQGIVGSCVEKQESVIIADAQQDQRFFRGADAKTGLSTRSLMSVPMVREGRSIGAIQAINKQNGALFTHDDLDLLRSIADSAALSIENARLFADLSASYDSTLNALAAALDLRDRETEGHSRRVVEYTARLAKEIGLDNKTITEFRRGALIHDIGKIGVPDAVLHKPGPLDPEERKIIEKHPQAGYEMLLGISYLQEEIKIVLAHQEKWDGTGYPLNLQGDMIPLGARLFAIADTFDALTSDRPYRKGRPYEVARQIIVEESGKQFDPQAVQAFLAIPAEDWVNIRALVMDEIRRRREEHAERVRQGHTGFLNPLTAQTTTPPPSHPNVVR